MSATYKIFDYKPEEYGVFIEYMRKREREGI